MLKDFRNKKLHGCCYTVLKTLPANSIDCCVTSPPYWQLRDYQIPPTKWPAYEMNFMPGLPPLQVPEMECCLGLETDPMHFVAHLVMIFEEVRRVLKPHGTAWINMGDSYCGLSGGKGGKMNGKGTNESKIRIQRKGQGLKVKDMVGIPWMMAFGLRAAGWYLRSDVIWHKDNAMPESVKDRPTKSHEYIFLLSKSANYFYDADAIREPHKQQSIERAARAKSMNHKNANPPPGQKSQQTLNRPRPNINNQRTPLEAMDNNQSLHLLGSNKRTVWTVSTKAMPEAHFAVFPETLIQPCIKAGVSAHGNCECGKPYVRKIDKSKTYSDDDGVIANAMTTEWVKTCSCSSTKIVRPIVIDPFGGSGTTALQAQAYNADYVLIDLNEKYIGIQEKRLSKVFGMFHN